MSHELELLIQLKNGLVNFLDELIESFPDEPDFVIFRIFVKDQIPISNVMDYIVTTLLPLQNMVKERNDDFFLNNNILFDNFEQANTSKINHFKRLWLSERVDDEDRNVIWSWFDSFLYLANKYLEIRSNK